MSDFNAFWDDLARDMQDPEYAELHARIASDNGVRHDLDDVLAHFGITRDELEDDEA